MSREPDKTPSQRRSPRLIAWTFVGAFAASVFTVIYTGLRVNAPRTEISAALPAVVMTVNESRTVNLVFTSNAAADDASLTIFLPTRFELVDRAGQRQIDAKIRLQAGNNILPLTLIAREPAVGQLVARLRYANQEKIFRVHVDARAP